MGEIGPVEKHRHAIVYAPRERVRGRDDHGARRHGVAALGVLPRVLQPGEAQGHAIGRGDVIGLLAGRGRLPFVIAGRRDDAARPPSVAHEAAYNPREPCTGKIGE
jgi:hypothetical protein